MVQSGLRRIGREGHLTVRIHGVVKQLHNGIVSAHACVIQSDIFLTISHPRIGGRMLQGLAKKSDAAVECGSVQRGEAVFRSLCGKGLSRFQCGPEARHVVVACSIE